MSLENEIFQNCPNCGSEQKVRYYQSVNITLQPELKNKVLSGKLNTNTCSNCDKEIDLISGFLYHDMQNRIMLELAFEDGNDDSGKNEIINNLIQQGYIYRKTNEYGRLIEKINIFDNKLNDLIIQDISIKMKEMLDESIKNVQEENEDFNFTVIFNKMESGLFKKKISFHCFSHPSQIMEIKYDLKNLNSTDKKNLHNIDVLRS
ncbi:CpXC domain-containing protein [Flavobacterium sp. xlx-214]|uniref:CpXC domain-containing protein n=1 Tax=unclassified Flavobacterium TaxID=196869 RepID=UPI0013D35765|nr:MULTISPECIES: CpXC domain-containing protein [unclassified Flavobacterium]MBA5794044.1 CpXC domain-containing protein [Flavobacterium sp. xlx-221]QMI83141.1 CpXC domain-containing protein [Flavobacterium sp. xlx-214]